MEYFILYCFLYLGSIALLCDDWRGRHDVLVEDIVFFAFMSVFLVGWFIWTSTWLSKHVRFKMNTVVLSKKDKQSD